MAEPAPSVVGAVRTSHVIVGAAAGMRVGRCRVAFPWSVAEAQHPWDLLGTAVAYIIRVPLAAPL